MKREIDVPASTFSVNVSGRLRSTRMRNFYTHGADVPIPMSGAVGQGRGGDISVETSS